MRIPSSSQAKPCGCIPSGPPRGTGACLAALGTRSTGLPQAFHGRSPSVPQVFHKRCTGVPSRRRRMLRTLLQANACKAILRLAGHPAQSKQPSVDWYTCAQFAHEWAFLCHALLGYACKPHSSSQVGLYWHSSVESKNGKNDSSKAAKTADRRQVTATCCPPDPHISKLTHSRLGGVSEPNGKQKWEPQFP